MGTFTLTLSLDSAAMRDAVDVANVLHELSEKLSEGWDFQSESLQGTTWGVKDANGNRVGEWIVADNGPAYWQGNHVELALRDDEIEGCAHSGRCDEDVRAAVALPYIERQFDKLDPEDIRRELREYGAWDEDELADDDANQERLLWVAAGALRDGA